MCISMPIIETVLPYLLVPISKTVVFCQRYNDCSALYAMLHIVLGAAFTHPANYPDPHQFRSVEM